MNATLQGSRISLAFRFDLRLIEIIRTQIPDRVWNHKQLPGVWSVPNSPWHCAKVIEVLKPQGFSIDPKIQKCADAKSIKPDFTAKLPEKLFPYQREGIAHIHAANGRDLIADDMGLGKSAEALVWANLFGGDRILIISPAKVVWKWAEKEIDMWAPERTWQVIETGKQPIKNVDILIMSYAVMVSKYEELSTIPFDTMIFDEAHYLKNASKKKGSQRGRVAKKLIKGTPYVLFLTGTPFKNKRIELFPLLQMLDPRNWNSVKTYGERYCGGKLEGGYWVVPPDGQTNTEELQARLAPIMLRRTKKQVANDLPDLTRVSIPITVSNAKEYEQTLRSVKEQARKEGYKPARALTLLNTLRQVVGMGKIEAAVELAQDILEMGTQVVIHAHHKAVVAGIRDGLIAAGLPAATIGLIDGSISQRESMARSVEFQKGSASKYQVMILSSAGKEGIDLYSGHHVIFAERQWTPADEEQIEKRLDRTGQTSPVTAHYLIGRDTVDERFDEIVRAKRAEFSAVVETDVIREIFMELVA